MEPNVKHVQIVGEMVNAKVMVLARAMANVIVMPAMLGMIVINVPLVSTKPSVMTKSYCVLHVINRVLRLMVARVPVQKVSF